MGSMSGFRITWFPVVLSFSFTKREVDAGAETKLRQNLEQLDIKFLSVYHKATTHVVSKKRNTPKGLQALVNGIYIVDDGFIDHIVRVAAIERLDGGAERSALEGDFENNWPKAMQYVPQPGNEPVSRPSEAFSPNPERAEVFDGYTFIFYNDNQHANLVDAISNGKGKALYKEVIPHETQIDDFIRYVKSVAGEKGLGEFEDGSEGRGVVVVRYVPLGEPWFEEFYTAVSLRLDHRLIDQKDFLDAILNGDASGLRRPLEVETPHQTQNDSRPSGEEAMDVDQEQPPAPPKPAVAPRRVARTVTRKRFRGFVADSDSDDDGDGAVSGEFPEIPSQPPEAAADSQEGLFVSQDAGSEEPDDVVQAAQQSQRKRRASMITQERDIAEEFAPTAAQLKRRRIAAGEDPIPRQPTPAVPDVEGDTSSGSDPQGKPSKIRKEIDIAEIARKNREEAEARARAEREDLEAGVEDLDLAEIRRLQIEEPMEIRRGPAPPRSREQDIADGRWDPAWNGRKNFKKFQQRGAVSAARPPQRIVVALEEVKNKGYGIGDDYWLEDEGSQKRKKRSQLESQSILSQTSASRDGESERPSVRNVTTLNVSTAGRRKGGGALEMVPVDESHISDLQTNTYNTEEADDDDDDEDIVFPSSRTRSTRAASTQQDSAHTQRTASSRSTAKRAATTQPSKQQPAKRLKVISIPASDDDDDDSEDEVRFRFKKR
jgi:hypothetical protein